MKIAVLTLLMVSLFTLKSELSDAKDEELKVKVNEMFSENNAGAVVFDPPKIWPVKLHKNISSGYGMRKHPIEKVDKFHVGIDIAAPRGTSVLASAEGEVVEASFTKNYGNYIIIKHDEIYASRFSQLSEITVKVGETVKIGSEIGKVGSSGMSTNPHLHFEIMEKGKHVDPEKFIKA